MSDSQEQFLASTVLAVLFMWGIYVDLPGLNYYV